MGICELYYNFLPTLNHFVIITINVNVSLSLFLCALYRPSAFL